MLRGMVGAALRAGPAAVARADRTLWRRPLS